MVNGPSGMEGVPSPEDHFKVNILVRQVGSRNSVFFNRVFERLSRQKSIQISDNPRRFFHANFVTSVNNDQLSFGELHVHHRVFGFIGVGSQLTSFISDATSSKASSVEPDDIPTGSYSHDRRSSSSGCISIEEVKENYDKAKKEYASHLVDSVCILLGYDKNDVDSHFSSRETLVFPSLDDSDELEVGIRDYLRAIYYVLESKRVDVSFEKMESPPCPLLPGEEKMRIGLENRSSKQYKKKCLGRCRKQHADFSMIAGLPLLALESYQTAIELLKACNDLLWLAGACEGWACAAMIIRLERSNTEVSGMTRTSSMTPQLMKEVQNEVQNGNSAPQPSNFPLGHQRHRSDENALPDEEKKKNRIWSSLRMDRPKERIETSVIIERFNTALENYAKYSFAALIEYNCMMKAVALFQRQRLYIEMENFHRDRVGKYLDDSFTRLDHHMKSVICNNSAALYKNIGFNRKSSFFARLGVLFRLHIVDGEQRAITDYRAVYPVLYKTLLGYGVHENVRDFKKCNRGPVQVQIKALHEVYTAAMRAELHGAAIRHLCTLLQIYFDDMDSSMINRLFDDLANLVRNESSVHVLNQRISVKIGNIILPPIQLSRFPSILSPELCALPPHQAPTVINLNDGTPAIFIYSPFQAKKKNGIHWVTNCAGEVSVMVHNCRNVELVVRELCLVSEGCSFEAVPIRLILPAASDGVTPARIKLIGVPRAPGRLSITGYSCEVLGLRNVCKLEGTSGALEVDVLPPLASVKIESSLPRAPIEENEQEPSAETTVYAGQLFNHSLQISNSSTIDVRKAHLQIWQPKVSGGPSLIELTSSEINEEEDLIFSLSAGETKEISFRIFGIDPTATADDESGEEKIVESILPLASTAAEESANENQHDLIPYTGRLLTCQFVVRYESDVTGDNGEFYERTIRLPLAVCIVPALTVSAWHVLPGDGPFSRYIVVDVTNSTDHDAELVYSGTRRMNVLPKETCRVPLLSPCCADVAGRSFYTATQKDSHMMQRMEVERLRRTLESHVARHLDIRWTIPTMQLEGLVPVGALLSSVSLLKQLVLPAISLDILVNDVPYLSEDDINVGIGEIVTIKLHVISSLDYDFDGSISLECYQEISSQFGYVDRTDNLMIVGMKKIPFTVSKCTHRSSAMPSTRCEIIFRLLFRVEGIHKLKPIITSKNASESLFSDEVFVSPIGFSVATKNR